VIIALVAAMDAKKMMNMADSINVLAIHVTWDAAKLFGKLKLKNTALEFTGKIRDLVPYSQHSIFFVTYKSAQ
jgi:hypothetical protein